MCCAGVPKVYAYIPVDPPENASTENGHDPAMVSDAAGALQQVKELLCEIRP